MNLALNQAHDWIATKGHPIDDQDDHFTDREEEEPAEEEPTENEPAEESAEDPIGDEVEHLMEEAFEQFSQNSELDPITCVSGDTKPGKTNFIAPSNVTTRKRPSCPKRAVTKKGDQDGNEDPYLPLPKRERVKRRTHTKVKADSHGSATNFTHSLKSQTSQMATRTRRPPQIRNGIILKTTNN